ncbi:uncharacterized protein LOC114651469 isoform X2 [Erpetoichthys calabaricus]|uniref:uncharacterized protein LOC114651469 isoform X2 n=1 Tax=Erpetoichthys calabaricus TaxID=27687 RepID=UPI00109FA7E0|nr:uncharacterized protein LOC114651469 isoform X2 [Erpetoichthys calabaricus]
MMTSGYISLVFLLTFATLILAGPLPPPQDADPNSTDVQDSAAFAVESFNYFSKEENLYKIVKIVKVQQEEGVLQPLDLYQDCWRSKVYDGGESWKDEMSERRRQKYRVLPSNG